MNKFKVLTKVQRIDEDPISVVRIVLATDKAQATMDAFDTLTDEGYRVLSRPEPTFAGTV